MGHLVQLHEEVLSAYHQNQRGLQDIEAEMQHVAARMAHIHSIWQAEDIDT
jgi:hypothetical protein